MSSTFARSNVSMLHFVWLMNMIILQHHYIHNVCLPRSVSVAQRRPVLSANMSLWSAQIVVVGYDHLIITATMQCNAMITGHLLTCSAMIGSQDFFREHSRESIIAFCVGPSHKNRCSTFQSTKYHNHCLAHFPSTWKVDRHPSSYLVECVL